MYSSLGTDTVRDPPEPFDIRLIPAASPDHHVALHLGFDVDPPPRGRAPASAVMHLLANVQRGTASIDLLLGAYRDDELVAVCLGVESPGAAALVVVSSDLVKKEKLRATVALLKALQPLAWQRSIALLEVLVPPDSPAVGRALREAGFHRLTRLVYLERRIAIRGPSPNPSVGLTWIPYTSEREPLFEEAIDSTYVQSSDCPELTGLRRTADVLAGHRATGVFDPALWWVAERAGAPVGVILLNRIPSDRVLELVYMGVACEARGTGVGDALLRRALESDVGTGAKTLALAVDERNTPARRLYARWGFGETGTREAWIVSPSHT